MIITVDVLFSIILAVTGYISVCYYFHKIKFNTINTEVLKLTKNKILYCTFALISIALLISLFNTIYKLPLLQQLKLLSLVLIILPISAVDLRIQKIPNLYIIAALIIRILVFVLEIIFNKTEAIDIIKDCLLGAIIIGLFFLLLLLIFKNSIGMGDVKLFAIMGLYQGLWGAINSVFFSLLVSFVISIILLVTKRKGRKDTISFGPSILLGTIIAISLSGM